MSKLSLRRKTRQKAKAEEERRAAEAAEVDKATQPRLGAIPTRYFDLTKKNESQIPPWAKYQLFQAHRVVGRVSGIRKRGDLTPSGPSARWSETSRRERSQAVAAGDVQAEKRSRASFHPEMPAMPPPASPKAPAPPLPEEEVYPGLYNLLPDLRSTAIPTPSTDGGAQAPPDLTVAFSWCSKSYCPTT